MARQDWYPGHMVVTQKVIRDLAPYLSCFIEVVDARAPELTRHRPLAQWVGRTPVVVVLNKSDTAEPLVTKRWLKWYREHGTPAVALSADTPQAPERLRRVIMQAVNGPYRVSVVGLPNLGKSTVLNRMVGRHRVKTGGKPGLTRGPQWIRLNDGWEWLDLPGVITPHKSRDWRLKLLGVVPIDADQTLQVATHAWALYHPDASGEAWLEWGAHRGYLQKGGGVDAQRTAQAIITGFRQARLGKISLEMPQRLS